MVTLLLGLLVLILTVIFWPELRGPLGALLQVIAFVLGLGVLFVVLALVDASRERPGKRVQNVQTGAVFVVPRDAPRSTWHLYDPSARAPRRPNAR